MCAVLISQEDSAISVKVEFNRRDEKDNAQISLLASKNKSPTASFYSYQQHLVSGVQEWKH